MQPALEDCCRRCDCGRVYCLDNDATCPDCGIVSAFAQVFGTPTWTAAPDAASYEDEATLRRSRGLSRSARRSQRGPVPEKVTEPWCDSLATRAERMWAGEAS